MSMERRSGRGGWHSVTLGDLCRIEARQVDPRRPEFAGLPLVNGENLETGIPKLRDVRSAAEEGVISPKYLFEPGDVLYSKLRPYLRKVVVAPCRGLCSADMYPLRPSRDTVEPDFLAWLLLSEEFTAYASGESRRARMPKLNREQLFAWRCVLPAIDVQQAICRSLDESFLLVERARAAVRAQVQACRRLVQASISNIFGASVVTGWPRAPMRTVASLLPSKSVSLAGDTDVLVATTGCLSESGFLVRGVKRARMWKTDAAQSVMSRGEILVARSNTPELVGRAAMFDGEPTGAVASDLTIRLRPAESVLGGFLAGFLSALYLTGYWKERAGGASGSMKKITRRQIEDLDIPVPPLDAQREIVQQLSEHKDFTDHVYRVSEAELEAVSALPSALLRQALDGEL